MFFDAASEAPCAVIVLQALPHPEAALRGINDQGDLLLVAPADSPPADEDAPRQEIAWLWRHGEYQAIGVGVAGLFAGPLDNGTVLYGAPVETEAVNNAFGTGTRLFSQLMRYDPSTGQSTAVSGQVAWEKMKVDGPVPIPLPSVPPSQGANPPGAQPSWSSSFAWAHSSSSQIAGGWMVDSAPGRSIMTSTLMRFTDSGVRTYDSHFSALGSWTFLGGGGVWPVDFQVRSRGFARNSSVFHTHGASINTSIDGQFPDAFWTNNSLATYFVHQGKGFFHNPFLGGSTIFDRSVELPGSETIYDLAPANEVFQSVVLGRDSQSGRPTLWGNTYGSFETCRLPAALPEATSAVIGRRISQTLQVPLVGGLWRNGRFVPAERLAPTLPPGVTNLQPLLVAPALIYPAPNLIAASVSLNNENRPAFLLPADIVPDFNRDGEIDDKDRNKVSSERPWRFWVNDNDDSGTIDGSDVPGGGGNGHDTQVNGLRDLVDWFPVFLDIKLMLEVLPSSTHDYVIENEENALNLVETTLTPATAGNYLKAELGPPSQRDNPNGIALAYIGGHFKMVNGQSAKLSPAFLASIENETGGVLILEANKPTTKPLRLVVRKKAGGEKVGEALFPLNIQSVEKMYRHLNVLDANGQSGGLPTNLQEPENMPDSQSSAKNFVFVHGYNVNPTQARGWFAAMYKRLWHSGSRAKFTGVTWYGNETQGMLPGLPEVTPNYALSGKLWLSRQG